MSRNDRMSKEYIKNKVDYYIEQINTKINKINTIELETEFDDY